MNSGKKISEISFLFGILLILVGQFGVYTKLSCRRRFQSLKLPPHTKLAKKRSSSPREIKLLCDKGYRFAKGKSQVVVKCRNGTIQNPIPSCRGCGVPPDISNGTKTFSSTSLGSKVTYSCDVGFTLVGRHRRRCRRTLKWSPWKDQLFCRLNKCPAPTRFLNGNVTNTDESYRELATLSFQCNEGYELRGEEDLVCRDNNWFGSFPKCIEKKCSKPGPLDNGRLFGNDFKIGSTVLFFCASGFTLYGSSKRTCQKDQTWNGTLTTCDDGQFHCREPGIPIDSIKTGKVYSLGNIVKYRCTTGFKLLGSNHRTCLSNKTWSGVQPKCVDENYRVFPPINETMQFFREGFVDSLLQTTCSGKSISCPKIDVRARRLKLTKYKAGLDLIFVLDTSSSIKKRNFDIAKGFIKTIVETFGVDGARDDGTKIACVTYGTTANLEFNFDHDSVSTLDKALKRIEKISYTRGGTATRLALQTVKDLVLPHKRIGSAAALFLITDGDSNIGENPNRLARELRNRYGVEMYVVGVGKKVKHESLKQLASGGGDKEHVFAVENYDALAKVKKWIVELKDYSKCGQVYYDPFVDVRGRIVGGEVVEQRERWPWAVQVLVRDNHVCGGTLISDRYVLTAAHCFFVDFGVKVKVADVRVFFGGKRDNIRTSLGNYIHPFYNKDTYYNDIALIKIPKLRRYTRHKQALCLPQFLDMAKIIKTGDSLFAVGWGATGRAKVQEKGKGLSKNLKQVKIPFSDDKNCADKVQEMLDKNKTNWYFNNATQFCAADKSGQNDTCHGDSGGPAMVLHKNPQNGGLSWYQVGIVSWGSGCAQKGEYGYYTKVAAFLPWIDKYIKS